MADKQTRSYLTLLLAAAFLLALQWAYPKIPFMQQHFKNSNFLSYYFEGADSSAFLAAKLDSSLFDQLDTLPDSADLLVNPTFSDTLPPLAKIDEAWFANDTVPVPDTANLAELRKFFTALNELPAKRKKVRVSYWGDSMIEGDLITQTLRRKLQQMYGGSGVGFVPFVSISAGFRRTVLHSYGGPWEYYSLVKNAKRKVAPFGLSGEYMMQGRDSLNSKIWATYSVPKGQRSWNQVQVFYGKGDAKAIAEIRINNGAWQKVKLKDTLAVNTLVYSDSSIRKFEVRFDSARNTVLFGVSLESKEGIQLDNLNLRGNSGMAQSRISAEVMRGFNASIHPDLIVLQFGMNVINASTLNYDWFERALTGAVRHYQRCYPEASILIIGVADKGFKKGDVMVSDPSVYRVSKVQYKVALKTGVAFWSLNGAMGGAGSMVTWADAEKPLANKDYTHLNFRGAETVGIMVYDFLMEEKAKYD